MITTTGSEWNRFCNDTTAFPEGVYLDDAKVSVDGKLAEGGLLGVPAGASVAVMEGTVCFPDGTEDPLLTYFERWQRRQGSGATRRHWMERLLKWVFER